MRKSLVFAVTASLTLAFGVTANVAQADTTGTTIAYGAALVTPLPGNVDS